MKTYLKDFFIGIMVVILLIMGCYLMKFKAENQRMETFSAILLMKNDSLKRFVNSKKAETVTQDAHIFEYNKANERLAKADSRLDKVDSHVEMAEKAAIDDVKAAYIAPVGDTSCVAFHTHFAFNNKWIRLYGTVGKASISIDTLAIVNTITVNAGEITHLFSRNEQKIEVINESPYFTTVSMRNITLTEKKHWYTSRVAMLGIGLIGGVYIASHL